MTPRHDARTEYETPLVPIRSAGTKNPLFIVPGVRVAVDYELVDAQFFPHSQLVQALGSDRPVYGLRTYGLGGRLETFGSVEQMASEYATIVQSVRPRGPYLLAGFCFGGVFAYEIARQLSLRAVPGALILLDTSYPDERWHHLLRDSPKKTEDVDRIDSKSRRRLNKLIDIVRRNKWKLHHTLRDIWASATSSLNYERSRQKKAMSLFQNDYEWLLHLIYKYRPQPYEGRIVLIATDDLTSQGLHLGWERLATDELELHRIPGNHGAYAGQYLATTVEIITRADDRLRPVQRSPDRGAAGPAPHDVTQTWEDRKQSSSC